MSPYIKKIHTFSLFLSNGCNKKIMFITLILSHLSLNLKTPYFILISHFCLMSFSLIYLVFVGFFITWFSSSTPLKIDLKIIFPYLVTSCCLKLLPFVNYFCDLNISYFILKIFIVVKSFECFWICMFFICESDFENFPFQGSLPGIILTYNAPEDLHEVFWGSLLPCFLCHNKSERFGKSPCLIFLVS